MTIKRNNLFYFGNDFALDHREYCRHCLCGITIQKEETAFKYFNTVAAGYANF